MRAKEFIFEGKMHSWHVRGIPGMKSLDSVDQYYDIYRFGLAMAAAGDPAYPALGDPEGVTENNPTTLSYTQADEDIINSALRRTGKTARQITPRVSAEPEDTNKQSPIQPKGPVRRNKE
jgi:hypothetical protein